MSCAGAFYACGHETPFVFVLPWHTGLGGNEIPDLDSYPPFCLFTETDTLPKGQYATFLNQQIEFVRCTEYLGDGNYERIFYLTDTLKYKTEFEIK